MARACPALPAAREGRTAPRGLGALARCEGPVTTAETRVAQDERSRQERVLELEKRQQIWRWLVLAALAGLMIETLWAGRLARRPEEA